MHSLASISGGELAGVVSIPAEEEETKPLDAILQPQSDHTQTTPTYYLQKNILLFAKKFASFYTDQFSINLQE